MGKRGQITVFIILGLAVLLAVGVVIYFTSQQVALRQRVVVDPEAQPVYDFVSDCAYTLAQEGILLLGAQGGYIEIPDELARTPTAFVPLDVFGNVKVPLWYFENEPVVPTVEQMESELANYVEDHLGSCTENFASFEGRLGVVEKSEPRAAVIIGEQDVTVSLDYVLDIVLPERTITIDEPIIAQPNVNLKQAYDLAVNVIRKENEESWFENLTVDFMVMDPAIPFDGLDVSCSAQKWRLTDIRSELQEVVRFNLPAVRIENTQYAPFNEQTGLLRNPYRTAADFALEDFENNRRPSHTPIDQFEYARMFYDAGIDETPLTAAFVYDPAWGMDLNGEPNSGGVLSSKVTKGDRKYLSLLCLNFYHFTYDVIYPVVLKIHDAEAFQGQGFTFNMAFPVVIDNNEGARKTFGYRDFRGFELAEGFCENSGDQVVTVRASGLEPAIGVVELDGVKIDYECINNLCSLGNTSGAYTEGFYELQTRLPAGCTNPFIVASKEGYLPVRQQVTTEIVRVELPKLTDFNVVIVKHPYDLVTTTFGTPQPLGQGENVSVFVNTLDGRHEQFETFPNPQNTLKLVQQNTNYTIDSTLTLFGEYTGGYRNSNIQITGRELFGQGTIVLNVIEVVPKNIGSAEYERQAGAILFEETYAERLRPEFR